MDFDNYRFTNKMVHCGADKNPNAVETAKAFVDYYISRFGPPRAILSDPGTVFQNKVMEGFARMFKIDKYRTTAFHPQSSGSLERTHGPLIEYLKQYTGSKGEWDEFLTMAAHAHNTAKHESTGYTPFELVYGFKAKTPSHYPPKDQLLLYDDYLDQLSEEIKKAQTLAGLNQIQAKHRSKFYYDRKLNVMHFREGEKVYLVNDVPGDKHKRPSYLGPYEITKIDYKNHNVELEINNNKKVVHIDNIKRAHEVLRTTDLIDEMTERELI